MAAAGAPGGAGVVTVSTVNTFALAEDIVEKLRLLDYETNFCNDRSVPDRELNRSTSGLICLIHIDAMPLRTTS